MALVDCPSCKKKISDKASTCMHCGFGVGQADAEDVLRKRAYNKYKKSQSLMSQSLIAVLMAVAGLFYVLKGNAPQGSVAYVVSMTVAVIGFTWYVVNRVRIILHKRSE